MSNRVSLTFAGKPVQLIQAFEQTGSAAGKMADETAVASQRMGERFDYMSSQSSLLAGGLGDVGGALTEAFGEDTMIGEFGAKMEQAGAVVMGFTGLMDLGMFATNNLKLAQISAGLATARTAVVTKAATAAQWAMNIAMRANPIGLVVTAITLLIGAVVLIARRTDWFSSIWRVAWGGIKTAASRAWDFIGSIPGRIAGTFRNVARFLSAPFRTAFNMIAHAWNGTIGGLSFTVPGWVPGIGGNGFGVPRMPTFHAGGVVPGVVGTPTVALLQAGEKVSSVASAGGGGEIVVRGDGSRVGQALVDLIATAMQSYGGRGAALGIRTL